MPSAPVLMFPQAQGQWCWAAVASSLAGFYHRGVVSQCSIVSALLDGGLFDCCADGAQPYCDRSYVLELALSHCHVDNPQGPLLPITFDLLESELHGGRPVAIRIDLGSGGHFVVIDSCDRATRTVEIQDPLHGPSGAIDFDMLEISYRGFGPWTNTYLTA